MVITANLQSINRKSDMGTTSKWDQLVQVVTEIQADVVLVQEA